MTAGHSAHTLLAPWASSEHLGNQTLTGMSLDSRTVMRDGVFLALAGAQGHGMDYLDAALDVGVSLVVWEPVSGLDAQAISAQCQAAGAQALALPALHQHASAIAARFYGYPGRQLRIIGVTGTDGKSSVAHYVAQLLEHLEGDSAVMGTLGWGRLNALQASQHTTTDPVSLQAQLAELAAAGVRSVAMEVSSHALAQHRVEAVPFDTAILTYMGRDHLDYHGSIEAYHAAKRRLFAVPTLRRQVLNVDDAVGQALANAVPANQTVRRYGWAANADYQITQATPSAQGLSLELNQPTGALSARLSLLGRFNAMNAMAALAGVAETPSPQALETMLAQLKPVPGRMERFIAPARALVVVDYAHTPGALEAALSAVREHTQGQLWCVFGCGGERDRGKRALMGAVAARLADQIVLTNDNPRHESPEAIIQAIQSGMPAASACRVIPDRLEAITTALNQANATDTVLIAGKGHETEQILANQRLAFSDRDTVAQLLPRRVS